MKVIARTRNEFFSLKLLTLQGNERSLTSDTQQKDVLYKTRLLMIIEIIDDDGKGKSSWENQH